MKPSAWMVVPKTDFGTPYATSDEPGPNVVALAWVFPLQCVDEDTRVQMNLAIERAIELREQRIRKARSGG